MQFCLCFVFLLFKLYALTYTVITLFFQVPKVTREIQDHQESALLTVLLSTLILKLLLDSLMKTSPELPTTKQDKILQLLPLLCHLMTRESIDSLLREKRENEVLQVPQALQETSSAQEAVDPLEDLWRFTRLPQNSLLLPSPLQWDNWLSASLLNNSTSESTTAGEKSP